MKQFITSYKGAELFEISAVEDKKSRPIEYRVVGKGVLPGEGNLSVEFIEDASNRKKAIEIVQHKVDRYLAKHDLKEFAQPETQH